VQIPRKGDNVPKKGDIFLRRAQCGINTGVSLCCRFPTKIVKAC